MSSDSAARVTRHIRRGDAVALRHPSSPGEVHVVPRGQVASLSRRGWVEAKSPEAKAAVEASTPDLSGAPTPKETSK